MGKSQERIEKKTIGRSSANGGLQLLWLIYSWDHDWTECWSFHWNPKLPWLIQVSIVNGESISVLVKGNHPMWLSFRCALVCLLPSYWVKKNPCVIHRYKAIYIHVCVHIFWYLYNVYKYARTYNIEPFKRDKRAHKVGGELNIR